MKKEMLFSAVLLLSTVALAKTEEFNFDAVEAEQVESITYTIKVFKDDGYDKEAWADLVALGTQAAKRGQASETGEVSTDDVVKFTLQAIEKSYECADKEGIHGNLNISVGSKEDATKGCEGICGGDDSKDR